MYLQAHQNLLLAYRKKISPGEFSSRLMPDNFYDLETEGLRSPTMSPTKADDDPVLHSQVYRNGLQVVSDDLFVLKRRFEKLKGGKISLFNIVWINKIMYVLYSIFQKTSVYINCNTYMYSVCMHTHVFVV